VMALFPVWKREYNDNLSMWFGMLAHEMFHPYQFTLSGLRDKLDRLDESTFTKFYLSNKAFAREVDREFGYLRRALEASTEAARKEEIRKFFTAREARRKKFIHQAPFIIDEPFMETAEGVAEYMNFRVVMDSLAFEKNNKLKTIDSDFDQYSLFHNMTEAMAFKKMEATKSYTQKIGVFTVILLNKVNPGWYKKIHEKYGEGLLKEFAGLK
jgi:hypothetical protein